MKTDLDNLMQSRNIAALVVMGDAQHNPPMFYLTGGGHINNAILVKRIGQDPVLFCNDMEREEAARTGLKFHCFSEYPLDEYLKQSNGDAILAGALRLQRILLDQGIDQGTVSLYGKSEIGPAYSLFKKVQTLLPAIEFIGEASDSSLIMRAMETKDQAEISRIRKMGEITVKIVNQVADYLMNRHVDENEFLLNENGTRLKIGEIKGRINSWLAEAGVENPHGTIFAIGHDAGVPHSTGNAEDGICLGKTIVFDIYPCESGGGYHYDFTRTWCLGYAPPKVVNLYQQVLEVYQKVFENIDLNAPFKDYQRLACEIFEKNGHMTLLNSRSPVQGYVHSLGHGVGLNIHERPWSGLTSDENNRLSIGVVATVEPGLYYPDENIGVRLEDSFCVNPDGKIEVLVDYPLDLVLPMKHWKEGQT